MSNFKSSPKACSWHDRTQSNKQPDFNCGAIQFGEESILTEFKRSIADCQLKITNIENSENSSKSLSWLPPDSLPDESVSNPNINLKLEFERQITFNLNNMINYTCVSINLFLIISTPPSEKYIISIELEKDIFFKHYIRRDQKFDTRY